MTITCIGLSTIISDKEGISSSQRQWPRRRRWTIQKLFNFDYIFFSETTNVAVTYNLFSCIYCCIAMQCAASSFFNVFNIFHLCHAMSKYQPGRCFFPSLQFFILFTIQIIIIVVVNQKYFIWSILEEVWEWAMSR